MEVNKKDKKQNGYLMRYPRKNSCHKFKKAFSQRILLSCMSSASSKGMSEEVYFMQFALDTMTYLEKVSLTFSSCNDVLFQYQDQ